MSAWRYQLMVPWLNIGLIWTNWTEDAHKNDGGRLCIVMERWAKVEILARISITRSSKWQYPLRYRLGNRCYASWVYCSCKHGSDNSRESHPNSGARTTGVWVRARDRYGGVEFTRRKLVGPVWSGNGKHKASRSFSISNCRTIYKFNTRGLYSLSFSPNFLFKSSLRSVIFSFFLLVPPPFYSRLLPLYSFSRFFFPYLLFSFRSLPSCSGMFLLSPFSAATFSLDWY